MSEPWIDRCMSLPEIRLGDCNEAVTRQYAFKYLKIHNAVEAMGGIANFSVWMNRHAKSYFNANGELKKRIELLEAENERLNNFCKEFIYGEENPEYYKTKDETIRKLEAENERLRQCVEFYADKENWCGEDSDGWEQKSIICEADLSEALDVHDNVGGERARQTLAEIKEN